MTSFSPRRRAWLVGLTALASLAGCDQLGRGGEPAEAAPEEPPGPAGATCVGRGGCPADQRCVEGRCRYQATNVRGEVLAASGDALRESGDLDGALAIYVEAIGAFEDAEVPTPPDVLCGAALSALRLTGQEDGRERAGRMADACFRGSLPGDPLRVEALRALGRLRYDGLSLIAFDEEEPASRFFTERPSRPTVDAVEIGLDLPDEDQPGYDDLKTLMQSEMGTRIIADCFIQDWELRHERQAHASLVLKLETRMRDMGDYDVYEGTATVEQRGVEVDGFVPCVAGALTGLFESEGTRSGRRSSWQIPFEVTAGL